MRDAHEEQGGKGVAGGVGEGAWAVAEQAFAAGAAVGTIAVAQAWGGLQGVAKVTGHLHRLGADLWPREPGVVSVHGKRKVLAIGRRCKGIFRTPVDAEGE